jgi:hypothetical protein
VVIKLNRVVVMSKINPNGPAYPTEQKTSVHADNPHVILEGGLTKFEKLAMEIYVRTVSDPLIEMTLDKSAEWSLKAADVFFEELQKRGMK